MERLLLSLLAVALLSVCCFPAFAQSMEEFEKERRSYKIREATAEKGNVGTKEARSPILGNAESDGRPSSGVSPLGLAANLPVGKQMPATAKALNIPTPEEMQMQMQMTLEAESQKKKNEEALFDAALKQLMPLTPEQIRRLLDTFRDNRESAETPIAMPVPRVVVETISLDPSQTPSVIKTSPGRVTTITILDQTGAPWAIQDVGWAGKFDITPPEEGGHVVRVVPQSAHGVGNISIRLVDMITPVAFTLLTGLDEVYYRFDARIPKQGPLAKTPLIEFGGLNAVTGTDENLVQILDGTPPDRSEKLKVEGVDGRTNVWRVSGRIYLRTPLTLLSPSWNSSVTSADGMNVYTLDDAPVVLLSDEGRMVKAYIAADEGAP
ncbi:MAG: DotH/IcmK family type IV secretion protein [Pseudomonadota bacterium]